jgi:hypothetical protein
MSSPATSSSGTTHTAVREKASITFAAVAWVSRVLTNHSGTSEPNQNMPIRM